MEFITIDFFFEKILQKALEGKLTNNKNNEYKEKIESNI